MSGQAKRKAPQQGIQSLEIGIRLFQAVHQLRRSATLTELSGRLDMHPAKLHRYCVSLIRTGLLEQDGRGRYGPGPYLFRLGNADAALEHARALAIAALPKLVRQVRETAFLSVWGQSGPTILKVEDTMQPISIRPTTQRDLPLTNTATGRLYSAFLDQDKIDPPLTAELAALGREHRWTLGEAKRQRTIFVSHAHEARTRLLARTTGERHPNLVSFAAPIFDAEARMILAVTVFGLAATCSSSWTGPVATGLTRFAAELTTRIGGRPPARA
jgi:DNA-binding IclR family transcriptional regulator